MTATAPTLEAVYEDSARLAELDRFARQRSALLRALNSGVLVDRRYAPTVAAALARARTTADLEAVAGFGRLLSS